MKAIKGILLAGLLMFTTSAALAGDESYSSVIGFSKDGRYFAYVQDGIQDGSGFYWAQVDVIEVATNKLLKRTYKDVSEWAEQTGDYDNISEAVEQSVLEDVMNQSNLNKYGINKTIKGKTLLHRPYTDQSSYKDTKFSFTYWAQGGASSMIKTYNLDLIEKNAPIESHNEWCKDYFGDESFGNKIFQLNLSTSLRYDDTALEVTTLQDDQRQPSSRSCAFGYKVEQVINYKDALVVLVNYQTPGFEGQNYRSMAVTASIPNSQH